MHGFVGGSFQKRILKSGRRGGNMKTFKAVFGAHNFSFPRDCCHFFAQIFVLWKLLCEPPNQRQRQEWFSQDNGESRISQRGAILLFSRKLHENEKNWTEVGGDPLVQEVWGNFDVSLSSRCWWERLGTYSGIIEISGCFGPPAALSQFHCLWVGNVRKGKFTNNCFASGNKLAFLTSG